MSKKIYFLSQIIMTLLYVFTLFIFLKKKTRDTKNLNFFYCYPLVGSLIAILYWLKIANLFSKHTFNIINTSSVLFHLGFLTFFIYKAVNQNKIIQVFGISFFALLTYLFYKDILSLPLFLISIANSGLFVLSFFYFYDLFSKPATLNLTDEPTFWICSGILMGTGILIPFNAFNKYFFGLITDKNISYLIGILTTLGYQIMYLFFIKAYLCMQRQQK